jgi:hypothetical protein
MPEVFKFFRLLNLNLRSLVAIDVGDLAPIEARLRALEDGRTEG